MPPLTPVGALAVVAESRTKIVVSAPAAAVALPMTIRLLVVLAVNRVSAPVAFWIWKAVVLLAPLRNKAEPWAEATLVMLKVSVLAYWTANLLVELVSMSIRKLESVVVLARVMSISLASVVVIARPMS